jgi:hypothetical protein
VSAKIFEVKSGCPLPVFEQNSIVLAENLSEEEIVRMVRDGLVRHVVHKNGLYYESEFSLAKTMVEAPERFFSDPVGLILGHPMPLEAGSANYLEVTSTSPQHKNSVLEPFENFLTHTSGTATIRENALLVADELYTNATRNWYLSGTRGKGPVREGEVCFAAAVDHKRILFGCIDSFGELNLARVIARLNSVVDLGVANAIQEATPGAGIGSYMVFSCSLSYYIGVSKAQRTVVMASMPLGMSARSAEGLSKNIHLLAID